MPSSDTPSLHPSAPPSTPHVAEFDFIDWIKTQHRTSDLVTLPPGDDLAILDWPVKDPLLLGVDQMMDGRHFDSDIHSPQAIGQKAMNRNLSDCAAMGCLPAAALLTLALPNNCGIDYAKQLFLGAKAAADPFYCQIVGGDTGTWDGKLVISITILGRIPHVARVNNAPDAYSPPHTPITRQGAQPGDGIYVTGPLGGSILGRHMTFSPRIALGRQLATFRPLGNPCIKAMIDLSDGLSRDLPHLLSPSPFHPQLGAKLDPDLIPIHADAVTLSRTSGKSPLYHALHDGEDYELLFTCPVRPPLGTRVGTISETPGVFLGSDPLFPGGWEHRFGS